MDRNSIYNPCVMMVDGRKAAEPYNDSSAGSRGGGTATTDPTVLSVGNIYKV